MIFLYPSKLMQVRQGSDADISREPLVQATDDGDRKAVSYSWSERSKIGDEKVSQCGKYTTHNAQTCPTLPHNQKRLEALRSKRGPGRPPEVVNKSKIARKADGSEGGSERPRT
jgi:hypothetical protein